MTTLNKYLMDEGLKKYKFAEKVGIARETVSRICNGKKVSPYLAMLIEVATNKKVGAETICNNVLELKAMKDIEKTDIDISTDND